MIELGGVGFMTREELVQVEFYKDGGVKTVLKKYEFNDYEKKIIDDAIFAAASGEPNMKSIEKADALLKMVASSREPIPQEEGEIDHTGIAKVVADTNMKKYGKPKHFLAEPLDKNSPVVTGVIFVVVLVIMAIGHYVIDW